MKVCVGEENWQPFQYSTFPPAICLPSTMTTSKRVADRKVMKFEKNINKRGAMGETAKKKGNSYPVGPIVLGFFIFVVIGSCGDPRWSNMGDGPADHVNFESGFGLRC